MGSDLELIEVEDNVFSVARSYSDDKASRSINEQEENRGAGVGEKAGNSLIVNEESNVCRIVINENMALGTDQNDCELKDTELAEPEQPTYKEAFYNTAIFVLDDLRYCMIVSFLPFLTLFISFVPLWILDGYFSMRTLAMYYRGLGLICTTILPNICMWAVIYHVFTPRFSAGTIQKCGVIVQFIAVFLSAMVVMTKNQAYVVIGNIMFFVAVITMGYDIFKHTRPVKNMNDEEKLAIQLINDGTLVDCIKVAFSFILICGVILGQLYPIYIKGSYFTQFLLKVFAFEFLMYVQESYQNYLMVSKSNIGLIKRLFSLYPYNMPLQLGGRLLLMSTDGGLGGLMNVCIGTAVIEIIGQLTYSKRYWFFRNTYDLVKRAVPNTFRPNRMFSPRSVVPIAPEDNSGLKIETGLDDATRNTLPLKNRYYRRAFMSMSFRMHILGTFFSTFFIYGTHSISALLTAKELDSFVIFIEFLSAQILVIIVSRFVCLFSMVYQGRYPSSEPLRVSSLYIVFENFVIINTIFIIFAGSIKTE